jgi:hypothetical protein
MICFNGPRPEPDGSYSAGTKYGLISVVIHEVGHNFFPMIVNSDERQWTWMDEGLNSFLQYLAEQEWERDYPSRRGEPKNITEYMQSENQVPIMTNSESVLQFGNNAYGKPATALNILRETVMGRELLIAPSANMRNAGNSNARCQQTFSARWRTLPPSISIGSGAAGSTRRITRTSRLKMCAFTVSTRAIPESKRELAPRIERAS